MPSDDFEHVLSGFRAYSNNQDLAALIKLLDNLLPPDRYSCSLPRPPDLPAPPCKIPWLPEPHMSSQRSNPLGSNLPPSHPSPHLPSGGPRSAPVNIHAPTSYGPVQGAGNRPLDNSYVSTSIGAPAPQSSQLGAHHQPPSPGRMLPSFLGQHGELPSLPPLTAPGSSPDLPSMSKLLEFWNTHQGAAPINQPLPALSLRPLLPLGPNPTYTDASVHRATTLVSSPTNTAPPVTPPGGGSARGNMAWAGTYNVHEAGNSMSDSNRHSGAVPAFDPSLFVPRAHPVPKPLQTVAPDPNPSDAGSGSKSKAKPKTKAKPKSELVYPKQSLGRPGGETDISPDAEDEFYAGKNHHYRNWEYIRAASWLFSLKRDDQWRYDSAKIPGKADRNRAFRAMSKELFHGKRDPDWCQRHFHILESIYEHTYKFASENPIVFSGYTDDEQLIRDVDSQICAMVRKGLSIDIYPWHLIICVRKWYHTARVRRGDPPSAQSRTHFRSGDVSPLIGSVPIPAEPTPEPPSEPIFEPSGASYTPSLISQSSAPLFASTRASIQAPPLSLSAMQSSEQLLAVPQAPATGALFSQTRSDQGAIRSPTGFLPGTADNYPPAPQSVGGSARGRGGTPTSLLRVPRESSSTRQARVTSGPSSVSTRSSRFGQSSSSISTANYPIPAPPTRTGSGGTTPNTSGTVYETTYAQYVEAVRQALRLQAEYDTLSEHVLAAIQRADQGKLDLAHQAQSVVQRESEHKMQLDRERWDYEKARDRERLDLEIAQGRLKMLLDAWQVQHNIAIGTASFLQQQNPHYESVNDRLAEIALYQPQLPPFSGLSSQRDTIPEPYAYLADSRPPPPNNTLGAGSSRHPNALHLPSSIHHTTSGPPTVDDLDTNLGLDEQDGASY